MKTYALIAQAPQPIPANPPNAWTEWGVLGVIVLMVVREGIAMFKQKDAAESTLTNSLIENVMDTNTGLRTALEAQSKEVGKVLAALEKMEQRMMERNTQTVIVVREGLTKVDSKVEALHTRLDVAGIADGHHRKEG